MPEPTERGKHVEVLADLVSAGRGQLRAVARDADATTHDSGPGDLVVGTGRPQAAHAIEHQGRVYVDRGLVCEPNTRVRLTNQGQVVPATGRSTLVMQLRERTAGEIAPASGTVARNGPRTLLGPKGEPLARIEGPVDAGPLSHLVRVVRGHTCIVLNDPQEHSPADRVQRVGGGFLCALVDEGFVRTRLGDCLAPMRPGLPTGPVSTVARDAEQAEAEEALGPIAAEGHSAQTQARTTL